MSKAEIVRRLKAGDRVRLIKPKEHKFFNQIRKAEKIQTNAVRFEGGSWLYFTDIGEETSTGFRLKPLDANDEVGVIYEWVK